MIRTESRVAVALILIGIGSRVLVHGVHRLDMAVAVIAFPIVEDALAFLRRGDSLIGRLLDRCFGWGAAARVRDVLLFRKRAA